ncbi:hypothetical protein CICLE_v10023790mg, partial [Citrus x clementina]
PKIVTVHQPLVARRPLVGRRPLVASLLFSLCHCVYVTLSLFLHLHSIHFVRGRRFLFLFCNRLATGCIMEIGEKINGNGYCECKSKEKFCWQDSGGFCPQLFLFSCSVCMIDNNENKKLLVIILLASGTYMHKT